MSSRRDFLRVTALAGGGLLLGLRLDATTEAASAAAAFRPNVWIRIEPGGRIVLVAGRSELGQGARTALAKILADELDVGLDQVTVEQAMPGPDFTDLGTGGSSTVMDHWDVLRQAGAAARELLVAAAAARWKVEAARCRTENGRVLAPGGRAASYGELAGAAARLPVPPSPALKSAAERRLVGQRSARIDGPAIVAGRAVYGTDVRRPGGLVAVVARSPRFGGALASFDASGALAVEGVTHCLAIASGVAVVARSTWSALAGRRALRVEWRDGDGSSFDSEEHFARLVAAVEEPGVTTRRDGAGRAAFAALGDTARRVHAVYRYPFAAHGALEPVSATAQVADGRCEIWSPTQNPNGVQLAAARALGISPAAVSVHVTLAGGGFGRRLGTDFELEAVAVARRVEAPVHLVWTREDDLVHGYFQAASVHRLEAALDAHGRIVAWDHRKASTPHNARRRPTAEQLADPAYLAGSSWGVNDQPYAFPACETSYRVVEAPVPIGPWRSVFAPSSIFARESFLDEVAAAAGRDPVALRLELLGGGDPAIPALVTPARTPIDRRRLRRVLEAAAARAGWGGALDPGHALGIAADVFHTETYVAHVVEVAGRQAKAGEVPFAVERVVVAVDCGVAIDPGGVEQQVESGVFWSLSNAFGETTFAGGRARESNYDTFRVATWSAQPKSIETVLIASDDPRPHGLGEPVVNSFAPALVNALCALTGRRLRRLPLRAADFA